MNGETGKIVRLGVLLGLSAMTVAGCVASPFASAPIDPSSPVAEATRAAASSSRHATRPTFADIPPIPTDVPSVQAYRKSVETQQAAGAKLLRDAAPETFTLKDTDAYAARARSAGKAPDFGVPTEADRADTAAFVAAARGRASAPSSQPK